MTEKEDKSEKKIPFWQKATLVLILLVAFKVWSYTTNGGENYGAVTQALFKVADTIIPWP
jgi:hypothetical protein